jgi:predicted RNA-binding Zn ribbon-like protein
LSLLAPANLKRLKVCGNCGWLFLDKSRNSSRLWCDMTVCGNRSKARQHYIRQRMQREKTHG